MLDVSGNHYIQSSEIAKLLVNRICIQEALCRMIFFACSRIDDTDGKFGAKLVSPIIRPMSDDEHIRSDCFKCLSRIVERFPSFHAGHFRMKLERFQS